MSDHEHAYLICENKCLVEGVPKAEYESKISEIEGKLIQYTGSDKRLLDYPVGSTLIAKSSSQYGGDALEPNATVEVFFIDTGYNYNRVFQVGVNIPTGSNIYPLEGTWKVRGVLDLTTVHYLVQRVS